MFCVKCGMNIEENDLFCPYCGAKTMKEPVENMPEVKEQPAMNYSISQENYVQQPVNNTFNQESALQQPVYSTYNQESTVQPPADSIFNQESTVQPPVNNTFSWEENHVQQPVNNTFNQESALQQPANNTFNRENVVQQPVMYTSFNLERPAKKKKNWRKPLAVAAMAVVIIGAAGYFLWPMLSSIINPEGYAITAMKKITASARDGVMEAMETMENSDSSLSVPNQYWEYTINLDEMQIDSDDYLKDFLAKDIHIKMETRGLESYGSISLGEGSSAFNIDFEMDMNGITIMSKMLSSKALFIPLELGNLSGLSSLGGDLSSLGALYNIDAASLALIDTMFSGLAEAIAESIFDGADALVENMQYTKIGKENYNSKNGDMSVTVFDVLITEESVKKAAEAIITSVLDNEDILSQIETIAKQLVGVPISLKGNDLKEFKELMLEGLKSANLGFPSIPFIIYVNSSREVVKTIFNLRHITGDDLEFSLEFIGDDEPSDYIVASLTAQGTTMSFSYKVEKNEHMIEVEIIPANLPGQYLTVSAQWEDSSKDGATDITLKEAGISANMDGQSIEMWISGDIVSEELTSKRIDAPVFGQKYNINNITSSQEESLTNEIIRNLSKLKGVLSPDMLDQLESFLESGL